MFDFSSVSDIKNLIINFNIDINIDFDFVFVFDFVFYHFSHDLIDELTDILISSLTDDFTVEASTQLIIYETEKDSILISENKNFYV